MPLRNRSGSSPIPESNLEDDLKEGSESHLPSFAKPFGHTRLRGDSFGAVEAIKQRARRDTTTSSDMSSESEFNSSTFKRKQIPLGKSTNLTNLLQKKFKEDEMLRPSNLSETINEDSPNESDASSLSSGFAETADPGSLLEDIRDPLPSSLTNMKPTISLNLDSPRKSNHTPSTLLQALPPPRPISTVQPISLLGQAIKARNSKPKNPLESFAKLSGKGALDPLYIRIYVPLSNFPTKSFEMPLLRMRPDATGADKSQVTVAEAIGLSLWRYHEEGLEPSIEGTRLNVNRWTLRIFDDGEVDFDFPALSRTKPIVDFTLNNNRGVRARLRERPYDEFALVEATDDQFLENQSLTPMYNQQMESGPSTLPPELKATTGPSMSRIYTHSNLKSGPQLADNPVVPVSHSTPRIGPPKSLRISFTNLEALTQITTIEVTTDTYIAEVLDTVCKRWKLDKADHILKVSGTNTVAPVDRTVEAMGAYADLILVRRRFATEGAIGFAGSPGSSSPNAPLLLTAGTPTKKSKRMIQPMQQPIFKQDLLGNLARYKRYIVLRKQPMSFTSAHQRLLLMDDDYMHILPGDNGRTLFDSSAKTSRIPFSMIVGCKVSRRHPKTFRVCISPSPFPPRFLQPPVFFGFSCLQKHPNIKPYHQCVNFPSKTDHDRPGDHIP